MARPSSHLKLPSRTARAQIEHRFFWNEARAATSAHFFTLGYTGRKLDEIIAALVAAGVRTVMDIRQNPVSMYRPEVSKANLKRSIETAGMFYMHSPELGVPRDIRAKAIDAASRDVIWEWYDEYVVKQYVGKNLHRFLNSAEHPVALMCVELDPAECHRHRLFIALENMGLKGFDL